MTDDTRYYADTTNIVGALSEAHDRLSEPGDTCTVVACDTGAVIEFATWDELGSRNLHDFVEHVAVFTVHSAKLEVSVHESNFEHALTLAPAGPDAIDVQQVTQPRELGGRFGDCMATVTEALNVYVWDLAECRAGSIANPGHLTSYELTFDTVTHEFDYTNE